MINFKQFLSEHETINEMATIVTDREYNITVQVNPSKNRVGDEYFKVYNSQSYTSSTKIARISIRKPKYIIHNDKFQKWELNNKEKRQLIDLLNDESDMLSSKKVSLSNWEKLIVQFNLERGLPKEETEDNFVNDLKYPQFLPIDLPMPEYMYLN